MPPVAAQSTPCRFLLGFATLRDLIGPETVGDCLADQRFAEHGDAQQPTTTGLLVWRKADNWTAFTNGYTTWLNGPDGLQQRLNTELFSWESDAGAAGTPLHEEAPPSAPLAPSGPPVASTADAPAPATGSTALADEVRCLAPTFGTTAQRQGTCSGEGVVEWLR
jgi:hypothetical protein